MESENKSAKTSKNSTIYLILFILIALVGLGLILTGFLVNNNLKDSFVPETIYNVSKSDSYNEKSKYYVIENDEYILKTPKSLGLYTKDDNNNYVLTEDEKFVSNYYTYDSENNNYIVATPKTLELYTSSQTKYQPAGYIYFLEIFGAALFLLSFGYLYAFLQIKFNLKKMTVKQMSVIAIFSALSVILYYFGKFNLPFFPSWLDIQFSDVPALLTSFMYGPASGVLIIIVRFFCKLPGTSTVGVGELADVLIGVTLCLVAGFFYKKHRTFKGAIIAMVLGMASATVMATVANWLILIPAYKEIAKFPQAALTGTMDTILGGQGIVTDANFMVYYLFIGVIPFNLFRYVLVFVITLILYKRLKMLIVHFVGDFNNKEANENKEKLATTNE